MDYETKLVHKLSAIKQSELDHESKIAQLLQVGCETLSIEQGVVSEIDKARFTVIAAYPTGILKRGESFDIAKTICTETQYNPAITCFAQILTPKLSWDRIIIQSYIGCNYTTKGKNRGTISFFSESSRAQDFNEQDKQTMVLLSRNLSEILQS